MKSNRIWDETMTLKENAKLRGTTYGAASFYKWYHGLTCKNSGAVGRSVKPLWKHGNCEVIK